MSDKHSTDPSFRRYDRAFADEMAFALSAMDCVLNGEKAVYASSEITTGNRTYKWLKAHGLITVADAREAERRSLIDSNLARASTFAKRLRDLLGRSTPIVTPAPLFATEWTQTEYLALWKTLIMTRVSAVYLNSDWQYSNGCAFEFTVATENGIPTFDERGVPILLNQATSALRQAIAEIDAAGFATDVLRSHMARLGSLPSPVNSSASSSTKC